MFTCAFKFFSSDDNPAFGRPVGQLLLGEDWIFVGGKVRLVNIDEQREFPEILLQNLVAGPY